PANKQTNGLLDEPKDSSYSPRPPKDPVNMVIWGVPPTGRLNKPQFEKIPTGDAAPSAAARRGTRSVIFEGTDTVQANVFDRTKLLEGNVINGPAIIEEAASTTVVEPGDTVTVNGFGHLFMTLGGTQ